MKTFNIIFLALAIITLVSCANKTAPVVLEPVTTSSDSPVDAWKNLIQSNQNKSEIEKLILVNDFFNQNILWLEDKQIWQQEDYWATPIETLNKQAGDCEDFCIAKYYTLLELGVPIKKLKLSYVKDLELNQAHMILSYYLYQGSDPLILDNKNKEILKGSQRMDLKPVYSFNGEGTWISKQDKLGQKVGGYQRNRLWAELSKKMAASK